MKAKPRRDYWTIFILAAVIVALLYVSWRDAPKIDGPFIQPHTSSIRAYVEERAVTELPHDHLIAMPIDGWLQRIELREGDQVTKGQTIAQLDTNDLADRVHQAEQRIAILQTKIERSKDHRLENNMLEETNATVKAFDQTVEASEAKLEATKAVLDFAKSELDRIKSIAETASASSRELREAETTWRQAKAEYQSDALELAALKTLAAVSYIGPKFIRDFIDRKAFDLTELQRQLDEASADLEIAKRNLDRAQITSPTDGVVLERIQTRRQFLPAGTPLLTIGRLDDMEVIAEVLTERATRIQPNHPVEIFGEAIPDGPLTGHVLRVYPSGFKKISSLGVEQQRVNVAIALDQRPPQLGVGFRVHVRIYYAEANITLVLPRTALYRGTNETGQPSWMVMTIGPNYLTEATPIETGIMNDDFVQITAGIRQETILLAHPSREITPGLKANPEKVPK